jgi:hypothetical protein
VTAFWRETHNPAVIRWPPRFSPALQKTGVALTNAGMGGHNQIASQ